MVPAIQVSWRQAYRPQSGGTLFHTKDHEATVTSICHAENGARHRGE
jgi:hypothetical protein